MIFVKILGFSRKLWKKILFYVSKVVKILVFVNICGTFGFSWNLWVFVGICENLSFLIKICENFVFWRPNVWLHNYARESAANWQWLANVSVYDDPYLVALMAKSGRVEVRSVKPSCCVQRIAAVPAPKYMTIADVGKTLDYISIE